MGLLYWRSFPNRCKYPAVVQESNLKFRRGKGGGGGRGVKYFTFLS